MAKKDPYREFLERDFSQLFDSLELKDRQRHYMRSRWLDQVLWMEGRASKARDNYYRLRLTSIVGGVIVPILVGLNIGDQNLSTWIRNSTIGLSTVVAVCAAVEEFFHYGERWRHYRRSVESLKTQGWQFAQLTGPYAGFRTHADGFNFFAGQVEDIIQKDVEVYATQVTLAQKKDDEAGSKYGLSVPDAVNVMPAPSISSPMSATSAVPETVGESNVMPSSDAAVALPGDHGTSPTERTGLDLATDGGQPPA